jgi:hypothetical protein
VTPSMGRSVCRIDEEVLWSDAGREEDETGRSVGSGASGDVEAEALAIAILLGKFYALW